MQISKLDYRKLLSSTIIWLILVSVFVTALVIQPVSGAILTLKWTVDLSETTLGALAADLVGDNRMEVIVVSVGYVTVLNGTDGSVVWTYPGDGIETHSPFEVADLDKDGIPEIIIAAQCIGGMEGHPLVLHGNNGSVYWNRTDVDAGFHYPVVCDIDGYGYPTVFFCAEGSITSLSYDGQVLHQTYVYHPCWGGLSIGDTNFDGEFELYIGDRSNWYPDPSSPGRGVIAYWAKNLTKIWDRPEVLCSSHCPMLADVTGDGILEVIAVAQGTGGIAVLNSTDGSPINMDLHLGLPCHSQPTIYDIDGDGNLEIISCKDSAPKIWDLVDWKLDATLPVSCGEPPKVADVTGDGEMEIIAASGSSIIVYDKTYSQVEEVTGLSGANEFTLVQDIDGDGLNELVVTSSSGTVYAYDTPAPAPTPRVRSTNQFYSQYRCGAAEYVGPPGPRQPVLVNERPCDGSTEVSLNPTLSIRATDFQGDLMNITFATNTTGIWQDIASYLNVGNGVYNVTPTNMNMHGTTYYWGVNATDSGSRKWTWEIYKFTTYEPGAWWDNRWLYRKPIIIDHNKVSANLTNFPVLIDLTDTDLASKAQDDGDDIAFADYYGIKLDHEIELFDGTSGRLVAWVNVPSLSSTADTMLYMYYGNPAASNQQNPSGVWDSNFMVVQHLNEKSGTHYDSTSNYNDGAPYGSLNQDFAGKIDGADYFDGADDYVQLPQVFSSETQFTMEAWFKAESGARYFVSQYAENYGAMMQVQFDNTFLPYVNNVQLPGPYMSLDTWYYGVLAFDGTTARSYLNAGTPTTVSASLTWPSESMYIGDRSDHQRQFHGIIDEVRISSTSRSADWIKTCYNNQYDPSTFYTVGSEESGPQPIIMVNPATTDAILNDDYTMYISIANVTDLYAWEFQLSYNQTILDLTSCSIVPGGLNEPTYTYYNLTDEANGHLWWAVSTKHPTTTGILYAEHAIFEMHFHTIATGTSGLSLYGTILSDSNGNAISHTVVNGSITVSEVGEIDLTVTDISILDHGCSLYKDDTYVNGSAYYYPVEVTAHNNGTKAAGPFYVKLEVFWINGSLPEGSAEISVPGLTAGTSVIVNFTSLFHPMHTGHYRLTATVDSRNNVTENNETNNVLELSDIAVTVMGDVNGDGEVNILDGVMVSLAWAATPSDSRWNICADVNHDGVIDILDGVRVAIHWSKTW